MCEKQFKMMERSDKHASIFNKATTSPKPDTLNLSESNIRRLRLNECVKFIYINRGKVGEISPKLELNEADRARLTRSIDVALEKPGWMSIKSPKERVKRQLFRGSRNNRKSQRPHKLPNNGGRSINFKIYSQNCKPLHKIRRGYLSEARKIVEQEIRMQRQLLVEQQQQLQNNGIDNICFEQVTQRFYQTAHELMTDMLKSCYRARWAMFEVCKSIALRSRFYLMLIEEILEE